MTTISFTEIIFHVLCGLLYLVGLVFGLNYEEISVYVCIYLWPALCVAMPAAIMLTALFNWVKKLSWWNTFNLGVSSAVTYAFLLAAGELTAPYSMVTDFRSVSTIHEKFIACQSDLMRMANELNMTYQEVNLWVYCWLFLAIAAVMWLWFEITFPRKWIINRLWRSY